MHVIYLRDDRGSLYLHFSCARIIGLSFRVPPICVFCICIFIVFHTCVFQRQIFFEWRLEYLYTRFVKFWNLLTLFHFQGIQLCIHDVVMHIWIILMFCIAILFLFFYTHIVVDYCCQPEWAPRGQCFWFVRIKSQDHSRSKRF